MKLKPSSSIIRDDCRFTFLTHLLYFSSWSRHGTMMVYLSVFHSKPYFLCRPLCWHWFQTMWNFIMHLLVYVKSFSDDVHLPQHLRKSSKMNFRFLVPHTLSYSDSSFIRWGPAAGLKNRKIPEFSISMCESHSAMQPDHAGEVFQSFLIHNDRLISTGWQERPYVLCL